MISRRPCPEDYIDSSIARIASTSKYCSPHLGQTSAITPRTTIPDFKRTSTGCRLIAFAPQDTQVVSWAVLIGVRRELRGDEDVEDFFVTLAGDCAFRVDERPFEVEALDDIKPFSSSAFSPARSSQRLSNSLCVHNGFHYIKKMQPIKFHFLSCFARDADTSANDESLYSNQWIHRPGSLGVGCNRFYSNPRAITSR